jgi:hypothetical protein
VVIAGLQALYFVWVIDRARTLANTLLNESLSWLYL